MTSALLFLSALLLPALAQEEAPPPEPEPEEEPATEELVIGQTTGEALLLGTLSSDGDSLESAQLEAALIDLEGLVEELEAMGSFQVATSEGVREEIPSDGPRTRGLAVGVNRFADQSIVQLTYATPDAWAFRSALVEASEGAWAMEDFPVLTDEGATREVVLTELERVLLEADSDDAVVLFFSTHGYIAEGQGYLFAHDSSIYGLHDNGIPMAEVGRLIDASPAKHVLLFTDACHSGAMGGGVTRGDEGTQFNKVLDSLGRSEGSFFSFSSSLVRQQSYEHYSYCGGAGAFTCGIRRALAGEGDLDRNGQVTLAELATSVPPIVMQLTNFEQTPEAKGDYDPGIVLGTRQGREAVAGLSAFGTGSSDPYGSYGYGVNSYGYDTYAGGSAGDQYGVEGGVVGGILGSYDDSDYDSYGTGYGSLSTLGYTETDYDDWSYGWRPTFVLGLRGGAALGSVSPQGHGDGASLDAGTAPTAALHFGLAERWWLSPSVFARGLWTSGAAASGASEALTRLGFGVRNQVYVLPYATFTPYVPVEAEWDGGGWKAPAEGGWANKPLSRTTLGTGLGLEAYPWWSGSFTFSLEATQHLSLGEAEAAGSSAAIAGRPSFTRLTLAVERIF